MGLLYYLKTRKTPELTDLPARYAGNYRTCFKFLHTRRVSGTFIFCCISFLLFSVKTAIAQESILQTPITIPRQNTTLYDALNLISGKAACFFIYDSQVIESNKRVKLHADNLPLRVVLDNLLENPEIAYKVIGQHILLYRIKKTEKTVSAIPETPKLPALDTVKTLIIKGYVFDNENKTAIPYATVGILEENIGTITNADGYFMLKVPSSYSGSSLVVSHMGYMSQRIPIQLLDEQKVDIFMDRRIISIQEVIIRYIDPVKIIEKAMAQRAVNYNRDPVYLTSFYREGVQKNNRYVSYSEAVFKVFKSSFGMSEYSDQVKLLKSRKLINSDSRDTVFVKLKAGVLSALQLDIVKTVPGFLDLTTLSNYDFTYSDLVSYNAKDAYAITFVQNKFISDPLFAGTLYVEKESFAILGADFEIYPAFLDKAADDLVLKKSHRLNVKLEKINYSVSYTPFNGKYYINHARCDIQLKTRLRRHLASDNFKTFFEFATCHIDTSNVVKFPKQEVLKPGVVFSDAQYNNDDAFWDEYNRIAPEEKLSEALSRIIGKIEEIE